MSKNMDIESLLKQWFAEAGDLLLRMRRKGLKAELKEDASPVTAIDRAVEQLLRLRIEAAFPDDGIIGEEMADHKVEAKRQWYIDPVDGTRALLAGFPTFTTLLALIVEGKVVLGAVYQPVTGEFWFAAEGQPTCYNGQVSNTSSCKKLENAIFTTTSPLLFPAGVRPRVEGFFTGCRSVQFGGDGYGYARLASGDVDLIVESGLKAHDFLALIPLIKGAGGIITDWQGRELTPQSSGDVVAAATQELHQRALERLKI